MAACVRMVPTGRADVAWAPDLADSGVGPADGLFDLTRPESRADSPGWPIDSRPCDAAGCPPCGAASATCWDVRARLSKTDFNKFPVEVFGQAVADGQTVYALLDGTIDDTYTEPDDSCPPYYTKSPRAQTWDVERKQTGPGVYRILVRGVSMADCNLGQPVCAGEIVVNPGCWHISQVTSCSVQPDSSGYNVTLPTFCTVDQQSGTITWQSGGSCALCCQCADAATVTVDVTVTTVGGTGG